MKKNIFHLSLICLSLAAISCNQSNDSNKIADKENERKFDNSNSDSSRSDRKDNDANNNNNNNDANKDMMKDAKFAVDAADDGMLEVQLGQLAQNNASSADVKKLAKHMVDQHSKANEELKKMAQQKNITLPVVLGNKNQDTYNDLAKKSGSDFDKAYTDKMVSAHKDAIDMFKKESSDGTDADIKNWANGKLPTLEEHLHMAESVQNTVKGKK